LRGARGEVAHRRRAADREDAVELRGALGVRLQLIPAVGDLLRAVHLLRALALLVERGLELVEHLAALVAAATARGEHHYQREELRHAGTVLGSGTIWTICVVGRV